MAVAAESDNAGEMLLVIVSQWPWVPPYILAVAPLAAFSRRISNQLKQFEIEHGGNARTTETT